MSSSQFVGSPPASESLFSRLASFGAAPFLLMGLIVAYTIWLSTVAMLTNVDVSWLLIVCDRLLEGARLNTDMLETNPPFSIWLYMPFMLLEKLVGGRAELWLTLGVICLSLASLFLSARILARADPVYRQPRALWLAACALFMVLCFLPDQFGQREQFALIGILPWLALQCARQRMPNFAAGSPLERIVAGLGAGVVVMVKPPHFALPLILPPLCLALRGRSLKPFFVTENILGASIAIAYVASIAMFDRAYFDEVLPFLREIYLPLRISLVDSLADWPKIVLLLAVATVIAAGGMRTLHWDIKILLASALGFVPAFLIMGKGWPNHALPMVAVAVIAFGVLLLRFGGFQSASVIRKVALVFGCALVLQLTVRAQYAALTIDNGPIERSAAAIGATIENPTIVSIAGQMQVAHPLTRLVGGSFVARQSSAWAVLNADLLARDADNPGQKQKLEGIRDQLIGEHAIEIAAKKPDIVLSGPEADPSWNALMLQDKRIAAALGEYRVLHTEPLITVYLRCAVGNRDCQVGRQASGDIR